MDVSFSEPSFLAAALMDNDSSSYNMTSISGYTWQVKLPLLVFLPALILSTVVGNVLVCLAVFLVPKIRQQPYTLLYVSLAVADLFVAVLVMPMALLYLYAGSWQFGRVLCDVFVAADMLSCTASILNLCAISVDRYRAITSPLKYSQRRGERLMAVYIGIVWSGAVCISIVPIAIIGNEHGQDDMCAVSQNIYYQIWATLMSFYLPLAVMIFVYMKILQAARRIVRQELRAQGHLTKPRQEDSSRANQGSDYQLQLSVPAVSVELVDAESPSRASLWSRCCDWSLVVPREKKASVTLGIIMAAFIVCWLPFFILAVVRPMMQPNGIPNSVIDSFLWLGYLNSFLNPVIYATFNKDFRKPFREILCFRCRSLRVHLRQEQYLEQYGGSRGSCSQGAHIGAAVSDKRLAEKLLRKDVQKSSSGLKLPLTTELEMKVVSIAAGSSNSRTVEDDHCTANGKESKL